MQVGIDFRRVTKYSDLMKAIQKALYASWGQKKATFVAAYPKVSPNDSTNTPIITHRVVVKIPGKFGDEQEIKPRIRETIKPDNDLVIDGVALGGKSIEVWGQMFEYIVEFEIWAESGEEADRITEEFQEFLFKYTGYLKKIGVSEILFDSLSTDKSTAKWRSELVNRTLQYKFRIDEIVGIKCPLIEDIMLDAFHLGFLVRKDVNIITDAKIEADGEDMLEKLEGKIDEFKVKE